MRYNYRRTNFFFLPFFSFFFVNSMLQSKGNLISGSVPIKLNYVIHHYILSAMDIKEEKLDYPVLPLSKLNFMERMFRSYIGNYNYNNNHTSNNVYILIYTNIYVYFIFK